MEGYEEAGPGEEEGEVDPVVVVRRGQQLVRLGRVGSPAHIPGHLAIAPLLGRPHPPGGHPHPG